MSAYDHHVRRAGDSVAARPAARAEKRRATPGHDALGTASQALEADSRAAMETRFGHDFTQVRVHADPAAARSALAKGARAYTDGEDLVFGRGEYAPHTPRGKELLAHELAHVVQQRRQGPSDRAEERADVAAARVMRGQNVDALQLGAAPPGIQRQPIEFDNDEPLPKLEIPKPEIPPFSVPYRVFAPALPSLYPPSDGAIDRPGLVPPLSLGPSPDAATPRAPLSEFKITPPQGQQFKYPSLPEQGLGIAPFVPSLDLLARVDPDRDGGPLAPKAAQFSPPADDSGSGRAGERCRSADSHRRGRRRPGQPRRAFRVAGRASGPARDASRPPHGEVQPARSRTLGPGVQRLPVRAPRHAHDR